MANSGCWEYVFIHSFIEKSLLGTHYVVSTVQGAENATAKKQSPFFKELVRRGEQKKNT